MLKFIFFFTLLSFYEIVEYLSTGVHVLVSAEKLTDFSLVFRYITDIYVEIGAFYIARILLDISNRDVTFICQRIMCRIVSF